MMSECVAATMSAELAPARPDEPPVRTSLRLVWLVGLVYIVAAATHPGRTGTHLAATVLTITTTLGWAGWLAGRHYRNLPVTVAGIMLLAASGGALVVLSPIGVAVAGVAGMCAASLFDVRWAVVLTAPSVLAAAVAVWATGQPAGYVAGAASGAAAGLVVGMGRRQSQQRAWQQAELALAKQRAQVEHQRAEVLAERNRIAREVHDVLAHTLSALAVQMEALGSLVDDGADPEQVRAATARSRRLVTEGLLETRRSVQVLRDEAVDVTDQLLALGEDDGVTVRIVGTPRPLSPAAGLALVRVAQEAVTNARKHAAGSAVVVELAFTRSSAKLTVDNEMAAASALAGTGGGYGLQGMQERIELAGGTLTAGAGEGRWRG